MNEGKPTKAKWWSRPRPQGPADQAEGAPAAPGEYSVGTEGAPPVPGPTADGDYELKQPQQPADAADAGGDFALRSPRDAVREDGPSVPEPEPGRAPGTPPEDRAPAGTQGDGDFELSLPLTRTAPAVEEGTADLSPKPLHDPDPYSTPPYGEPGPWAPAPPVQHPAGTPSHGTAIPTPPQAHGTPAPTPGAPSYADAPPPAPYAETPPTPPPADPWRNYDPWAPVPLPTSLQQNGAPVPTRDGRRKRARKVLVVGAVLLALVSGGVGGAVGAYLERDGGVGDVELPQADAEPAGRAPDSVAGIAARALPSVVTLQVSGAEERGTGTGFVLDDRGYILTNNHVVEPAGADGDISVTFHSGDTAKATVVGRDSGYDLAVVKVTGVSGLQPMTLGNSDSVQVGDPVVAIGAPFGLEGTVTSGIISAKERPITAGGESGDGSDVSYVDALQTDAPINPGNSGGPLLDSRARVIGINSAIRSADDGSDSGGAQSGSIGLGFAIPVNQGKRVAEELINTGKATHPVIGVTLDMAYSGDGARVGTKGNDGGPAVIAGGAGDKAGIKSGDVITEVDGQRIHSGEELIVKTRAHRPGDRLELTVERGGEELAISLVLGSSDGD
ncbi:MULTISPECIES: trypsin-like peptidase domain-containing protein [unclassified Streptomyces]|uniref:trypsin-like peptidase domain-containing protein n=1 Tax=unclassified Streptomyces TaxID=2593676 RepID=UPI0036EF1406